MDGSLCLRITRKAAISKLTSFLQSALFLLSETIAVGTIMEWISPQDPEDMWAWLECDGRAFSATEYPELARLYPGRVPDLRNQFLRGGTAAQVGQTAQDSTRSHNHTQPAHTHSFSGQLASTALSGTAAGQIFADFYTKTSTSGPSAYLTNIDIRGENANITVSLDRRYITSDTKENKTNPSAVTGRLDNGRVNGSISTGGDDPTDYTGGEETAPQHIRVRYLIRARP